MKVQNYSNHRKYHYPHHFIFYPLLIIAAVICWKFRSQYPSERHAFDLMLIIIALLGWLSFMTRQHYALKNQNRIIRLEMRLRYYQLTQKRLEALEDKLSFGQIAALRFASDEELPDLITRTIKENLSAEQIKKAIKSWLPDTMRV
ncbi:MAG: hypothetical protein H7Y07_10150 [Pyrinomonadaceae bacterium]|nr:hypothetical protein [Sphingobacteriaceae bacterium]